MDTVKLSVANKPLMVAHRGLSGIETENTAAAFVAAGNRSYWGVECDVHRTLDGAFVILHDDNLERVAGIPFQVGEHTLAELRAITLRDLKRDTGTRGDLVVPTLQEYVTICRQYGKHCVIELKDDFTKDEVAEICAIIEGLSYLDCVTFISFTYQNLVHLRALYPAQPAQFLKKTWDEDMLTRLKAYNLDLDFYHKNITPEIIAACHENGIRVNLWTVDDPARAAELAAWGADYITTNILE